MWYLELSWFEGPPEDEALLWEPRRPVGGFDEGSVEVYAGMG